MAEAYTSEQQQRYDAKLAQLQSFGMDGALARQYAHWYAIESEPPVLRLANATHASVLPASWGTPGSKGSVQTLMEEDLREHGWPPPLDLARLAQHDPTPPRFIVPDWLPCQYATLLAGHGGIGKSGIALNLAVCIANGLLFFGVPVEQRRVLYLSCEDRENVLHWRLARICDYLGIELASLSGSLFLQDLVGEDVILWERDPQTGMTTTPAFLRLRDAMAATGAEVLIVDGVSDVFGGSENARGDVKRFVNALLSLVPENGALLLLGHVAKPAASGPMTSEGYSGSTAWHNSVRARWYLAPEIEDNDDGRPTRTGKLTLELQKSNLGPTSAAMQFAWDEDAHLFVGKREATGGGVIHSIRERAEQAGILKAMQAAEAAGISVPAATQGQRTAFRVLSAQPAFPDSLRSGKPATRRFWRHIEALRAIRHITDSSITRADRHKTLTIVLTPEGVRACGQ